MVSDIFRGWLQFYLCWTGTAYSSLTWWQRLSLYGLKIGDYCISGSSFPIQDKAASCQCIRFPQDWSEDLLTIPLGVLSSGPRFLNRRSSGIWDSSAWAFCWVRFLLSQFPAQQAFPCAGFSSRSASTAGASLSWAPAALGLFHVEVVSARLNQCHGTIDVRRVYAPRFCVSSQQRLGVMDIKAPSVGHSSQVLDRPCYSS